LAHFYYRVEATPAGYFKAQPVALGFESLSALDGWVLYPTLILLTYYLCTHICEITLSSDSYTWGSDRVIPYTSAFLIRVYDWILIFLFLAANYSEWRALRFSPLEEKSGEMFSDVKLTYYGTLITHKSTSMGLFGVANLLLVLKALSFFSNVPMLNRFSRMFAVALPELLAFVVVFLVVIFGFTIAFFQVFSATISGFSSLGTSTFSLFRFLTGDFQELDAMEGQYGWLAQGLFATYLFLVLFITFSVLVPIVFNAYAVVQEAGKHPQQKKREHSGTFSVVTRIMKAAYEQHVQPCSRDAEDEKLSQINVYTQQSQHDPRLPRMSVQENPMHDMIHKRESMQNSVASSAASSPRLGPGLDPANMVRDDSVPEGICGVITAKGKPCRNKADSCPKHSGIRLAESAQCLPAKPP